MDVSIKFRLGEITRPFLEMVSVVGIIVDYNYTLWQFKIVNTYYG